MNQDQISVVETCAAGSRDGTISFGEVVARLTKAGIERYHADYSRHETTYYMPDGGSHVVPMGEPHSIAARFWAAAVEAAIRKSQRGEIKYPEFVRLSTAAGCVGYFVQLTGRRVLYFGRDGDMHVEPFPTAK